MIDPSDIHQLIEDHIDGLLDSETDRELVAWLDVHPNDARAHQRLLRAKQLVALKRYESPGREYFEQFVDRFHQRLLSRDIVEHRARVIDVTRWLACARDPMAVGLAAVLALLLGVASLMLVRQFQPARARAVANAAQQPSATLPDVGWPRGVGPIDPLLVAEPGLGTVSMPASLGGPGRAAPGVRTPGQNHIDPVLDLERLRADYDQWFDRVRAAERQAQASPPNRRYPIRQMRPPLENAGYGF